MSVRMIEQDGIAAVSLRRVARAAGVSPGAPYHHFADRSALLAALAARGFRLLADALAAAKAAATTPAEALGALIRAYVDFAQREPAYFQLMFRPELSQPSKHPDVEAAAEAASAQLEETVAECAQARLLPAAEADTVAVAAWSLAHGLASLWHDGQLQHHAQDLQTLAARVTSLLDAALGQGQTPRSSTSSGSSGRRTPPRR